MSTGVVDRLRAAAPDLGDVRTAAGRVAFGDRTGLFVFLVVLAGSMLGWRTVVTMNDNFTVVNGLVALADGHLHVTEVAYGPSLDTPGMVQVDGRAYPRNVAHIVFALPFLWALEAVTAVVDPRIAIAAGWSLLLLGACVVGGQVTGVNREARVGGSLLALVAFGGNVAVATPLSRGLLPLLALQLSSMLAAAFLAVFLYRLLSRMHGRRVGLAAGLAIGLASPTLFWASVPKRHVLTAALAVASVYLFYRSREADAPDATTFRLLAYVPGGLTAWLNAAEGLVLLLAVAVVDLLTARRTTLRTLLGIAAVVAVSLVPFFVTNYLISGGMFSPPRTLPDYGTGNQPQLFDAGVGGDDGTGGGGAASTRTPTPTTTATSTAEGVGTAQTATGPPADTVTEATTPARTDPPSGGTPATTADGGGPLLGTLGALLATVLDPILESLTLFEYMWRGLQSLLDPDHVYRVFVRSGYITPDRRGATGLAVNLTFFESLPLAGAVLAAPIAAFRHRDAWRRPAVTTDLLVLVYGVCITLLYVHRLPIHATVTVRYLFPLFPLTIYGVARLPWVRDTLATDASLLTWSYAVGVLIGGQLLAATVVLIGATPDEAIQACALLSLGLAAALAVWSLASALDYRANRVGAVLLGLTAATTTNAMLLIAVYFFGTAFALPLVPA